MKNLVFIFITLVGLSACGKKYNCECKTQAGTVLSENEVEVKWHWDGGDEDYVAGQSCPSNWRQAGTPDSAICTIK